QLDKTGLRIYATDIALAAPAPRPGAVWNSSSLPGNFVVQDLIQARTSARIVWRDRGTFVSALGIDRFLRIWFGSGNRWTCCRLAHSAWRIASHRKCARQLPG